MMIVDNLDAISIAVAVLFYVINAVALAVHTAFVASGDVGTAFEV